MFINLKEKRVFWLCLTFFCAFLIGAAYYFQHVMGLEPCFLCIVQRIAVILVGLFSLIIFINPRIKLLRVAGLIMVLISAIGGLIAAGRQVYMQHFPNPFASCGPGFEYVLENSPLTEALPRLFMATGNCSEVTWTFMGLSMAEIMLGVFLVLVSVIVLVNLKRAE